MGKDASSSADAAPSGNLTPTPGVSRSSSAIPAYRMANHVGEENGTAPISEQIRQFANIGPLPSCAASYDVRE